MKSCSYDSKHMEFSLKGNKLASYFYIITKTMLFTIGSDVALKKARAAHIDFFFLILSTLSCGSL